MSKHFHPLHADLNSRPFSGYCLVTQAVAFVDTPKMPRPLPKFIRRSTQSLVAPALAGNRAPLRPLFQPSACLFLPGRHRFKAIHPVLGPWPEGWKPQRQALQHRQLPQEQPPPAPAGQVLRHCRSHPVPAGKVLRHCRSHPASGGQVLRHGQSHPASAGKVLRHCQPHRVPAGKFLHLTQSTAALAGEVLWFCQSSQAPVGEVLRPCQSEDRPAFTSTPACHALG